MSANGTLLRRVTARNYLASHRGERQKSRGLLGGLGPVSDVIGIIDWIQGLTSGGSSPTLTPEDLAAQTETILKALYDSQHAIEDQIGGLGDQMGGVAGQLDELKEMTEAMNAAQQAGNQKEFEKLQGQLDQMLVEQRQNTQQILGAIGGVSNLVTGMWGNMDRWFGETLEQLAEMEIMLQDIGNQLSEITSMLEDVLEGISEVKDKLEWVSVISVITQHQICIRYAIETALDIHVTIIEAPLSETAPAIRVDQTELENWARKTVDLATGLPFHLYGLHRVLMGDTIIGKPLMQIYFQLISHQGRSASSARYFMQWAALQAQGFGVLNKARQYLAMAPVDYSETLRDRVTQQVAPIASHMSKILGVNQWHDEILPPDDLSGPQIGAQVTAGEEGYVSYFMLPPDTNHVICDISISGRSIKVVHGAMAPGTLLVPETTLQFMDAFMQHFPRLSETSWCNFDDRPITISDDKVVVGFKLSCRETVNRIEPVVASFTLATGVVDWKSSGSVKTWEVTLPESSDWIPPMNFYSARAAKESTNENSFGSLRGVKFLASDFYSGNMRGLMRIGRVHAGWIAETGLPLVSAPTEGAIYTEVSMSKTSPYGPV